MWDVIQNTEMSKRGNSEPQKVPIVMVVKAKKS